MSTKKDKAIELFIEGYNCSQAVLGAFCEDLGLDSETALKLSSSFGAGMGKLREVCGAVSAMFMIAGLADGYSNPDATDEKTEHYKRIQELAEEFKRKNDTIICRDLLKNIETKSGFVPETRTEEYYKARPCARFVGDAAEIIEKYLDKK